MANMRGNLAIKEKTSERGAVAPRYRETTKVVTRKSPLPVREKLLYMLTVAFCVTICGLLIWQNSNVYNLKYTMHKMEKEIAVIKVEIAEATVQKQKLEESVLDTAIELGYQEPAHTGIEVQSSSSSKASASSESSTTARK